MMNVLGIVAIGVFGLLCLFFMVLVTPKAERASLALMILVWALTVVLITVLFGGASC